MSGTQGASGTAARAARLRAHVLGPVPFDRQVLTHAVATVGDALFTVSLAGSLFFSVSVDAARPRVLLYLVLTLAPFAVVGPLIGPVIDRLRGGHRAVVIASCAARAVLCAALALHLRSLLLFPLAFGMLVLGKTYSVAKAALVPQLVPDRTLLVASNALLARVAAVAAALGGGIGAAVLAVGGPRATVLAASGILATAAVVGLRIPRGSPAPAARAAEAIELEGRSLAVAAAVMSVLRGAVGFTAFLLAFSLRRAGEPPWYYGLTLVAAGLGGFAGTFLSPRLRRRVDEVTLLAGALLAVVVPAVLGGLQYGRTSVLVVAVVLGLSAAVARQAFDSLTQVLAPDADRGRTFARFEARFQLAWVVGAIVPTLLRPSGAVGFVALGVVLGVAGVGYVVVVRRLPGVDAPEPPLPEQLLSLARSLVIQGAYGPAVVNAVAAARAARAGDPELDVLEQLALADHALRRDAERAIAHVAGVLGARGGVQPVVEDAVKSRPLRRTSITVLDTSPAER